MSVSNKLVIIGGGGFAREVIWLARESHEKWNIIGILDDNPILMGKEFCGIKVIGPISDSEKFSEAHFVVAVGTSRTRKIIVDRLLDVGVLNFATLIHRSVLRSEYVEIGAGSIIAAGCILTTQIRLGSHTNIHVGCTVGHDVVLGDFCTLAPSSVVSGNVTLEDGVEVGAGSVIIQGLVLGRGSFVGAGAVVTKNIPANVLVVGSPARQVKLLEAF